MQFSSTAVAFLIYYVALGTCLEKFPNTKMAKGNSFSKPKMPQSKEHNFKILSRKLDLEIDFGEYISDQTTFNVEMYNDTMPVINGKLYMLKDFPADLMIQVKGSKFSASNQWIPSFDQGKQSYCHYMETNVSFMKNVLIASDFKECPIKEGVYTISNMVIDEKGFPPGIPECQFKVDAYFTIGNKQIARLTVFADIVMNDDDDDK